MLVVRVCGGAPPLQLTPGLFRVANHHHVGVGADAGFKRRPEVAGDNVVKPGPTLLHIAWIFLALASEIDLDDGVKKNYELFADILAKI